MVTRLHADPEYADLIKTALRAGGQFRNGRKHQVLALPSGQIISISRTPSDWRAARNGIKTLRRALIAEGIIQR